MIATRRKFLSLSTAALAAQRLSAADDAFLEDLSRRAFLFFWEQADPATGLILDRARTTGSQPKLHAIASIASTGFGLSALCIAHNRKWADPAALLQRVRNTLRHLARNQEQEHGWFYHFVDFQSGQRAWKCELSTIDTALLLAGVLTAQQCFHSDAEIVKLAQQIYARVDFPWMLDDKTGLLCMGWKPESGFLPHFWDKYSENSILSILAIASPSHPIPADTWYRFEREAVTYENFRFVGAAPIFTHQYSQAWMDLRNLRDGAPLHLNYFKNSITSTEAHRAFCLSLHNEFPGYSENIWGVTPSDSPKGYVSWGYFGSRKDIDGTVVPCAAGGSLMFTPELSLAALHAMQNGFGQKIYGRYGFADAFHPLTGWVDPDVIGIDQGIVLLSAENLRTGNVRKWFSGQPDIRRAMNKIFEP